MRQRRTPAGNSAWTWALGLVGLWLSAALPLVAESRAASPDDEAAEFFEARVRPILAAKCWECHGDEEPEADLRLTSRDAVLKGGARGPAAIVGKPSDSLLIRAIAHRGKLKMPPDEKLRDEQIQALTRWVESGLPWPAAASVSKTTKPSDVVTEEDRRHWAFQPIANPAPPSLSAQGEEWAKTSVDRFIFAKLSASGLAPSPPADRRDLIRRAYYDLTGLPPSWDEVQAFVNDPGPTPKAFEKIIDRLLASPRYGERWGRHWLDVARYADSKDGVLMYGEDRVRPFAYAYRDYVIRAFNEDLPYDRFVKEQLAADLIEPKVEPWRLAAMGFLTLGRMYDNNLHDVIDDQIDVTTRGFLGLTAACARCHDHKYDPIPTADYYSLYGTFASSEAPLELPLIQQPKDIPGGEAFEKEADPKRKELRKFLDEQFLLLSETSRARVGDYLIHAATTQPDPLETAIYFLSLAPEDLRPPMIARWRRYLEQRAVPDDPVFGPWRDLMTLEPGQSFAKEASAIVSGWSSKPQGTEPGQLNPMVREALAKATLSSRADVARTFGDLLKRVYDESKLPKTAAGPSAPMDHHTGDSAARRQLWEIVAGRDSPSYFPKNDTRRYMSRQPKDAFGGKIQELDRMAVKSPNAPCRAMVLYDAETPFEPRVFTRGNPSMPGKHVPRQFPAIALVGDRKPFSKTGSGRLDLAEAIASPQNPLSARVIVNRVWMWRFGEPLVPSPSDFGKRCAPPSHPELLDHLASQFAANGWSFKWLHRLMMTSSVYQQSTSSPSDADADAQGRRIDPDNRLHWRMNRQRLDFESMRDTMLSISGRLQERAGGRPVDIAADPESRCRTVFAMIDRQSLPAMFRAFDFASPDQSIERRPRTMTPQQALFAINSPYMIAQAKALANRPEIAGQTDPSARIAAMFRTALVREPRPEEASASLEFLNAAKDEGSKLGRWEQFAQVLLSSNELMYLD